MNSHAPCAGTRDQAGGEEPAEGQERAEEGGDPGAPTRAPRGSQCPPDDAVAPVPSARRKASGRSCKRRRPSRSARRCCARTSAASASASRRARTRSSSRRASCGGASWWTSSRSSRCAPGPKSLSCSAGPNACALRSQDNGRLDKFLAKRRRKNASKDHKRVPMQTRE